MNPDNPIERRVMEMVAEKELATGRAIRIQDDLYRVRQELTAQEPDAARFRYLQNILARDAQAFFWNHSSRKQRAAAIDAAMLKEGK